MPDSGSPPDASDRSISGISRAREKQIARELSPAVAWPTLALTLVLPSTFATVAALGLTGRLALWACLPILSLVSYAHYTLVHESIHGNVVAGNARWAWVNTVVGWIGALGMGAGWPALQRTHVLHHAHTNTERDPDIFVKGTFAQLLVKWVVGLPFMLIPMGAMRWFAPTRYQRLRTVLSDADILQVSAVTMLTLALLVAALATGRLLDWLFLWFLPTRIGVLILNIFFQWLPHYPFDRTERYRNTRVSLWAAGAFLTLQQNLHLMHHLWPSVPFYNYARLYRALRPVLVEEGSRIEGFGVGSWARSKA
ncbi:MAG TPA: fatty acid desaturase [Caulobacteraceae bacterium]|nr:fatty acid desaturase [Caulobacteraceae bacterium]